MRTQPAVALLFLTLAACQRAPAPADAAPATPAPTTVNALRAWPLPTPDGAAQHDLIPAPDGALLLSWIEPQGEGHALKFARYTDNAWTAPQTIATGTDWFVNWADTPHLAATDDGALWAHWLQKSAAATYAYDVALVRSADGGATWSRPLLVNDDGTPTEHGFVSLWPAGADSVGVAWLDGREAAAGHDAPVDHGGHGGGMMTLRSARFDAQLARSGETRLDASACDCCQTDSARTARGRLLVYRDRTAEEIRDIYTVRETGTGWAQPRRVHADAWTMPACPVNGPAVDARGNDVVVGWYTGAGDAPTLKLARSTDSGDSFTAPLVLDRGAQVQGRVDVALDPNAAWALWNREDATGQSLHLARLAPDLTGEPQRIQVATLTGRGRATGFPQLVLHDGTAYMAWTDVVDGKPRLRGAVVRAD